MVCPLLDILPKSFGIPTTGSGVELGIPTAQLNKPGKGTGIYQFSRVFSLVENRTSHGVIRSYVSSASAIMTSVFASSCSPKFEGVFPATHNDHIFTVGIFCTSLYPFESEMLLIALGRVLV